MELFLIIKALIYSQSNFESRCDVTRYRLRISGELPLNARVVYGMAAKRACCMVTRLKINMLSTACDITSNLEVGQSKVK